MRKKLRFPGNLISDPALQTADSVIQDVEASACCKFIEDHDVPWAVWLDFVVSPKVSRRTYNGFEGHETQKYIYVGFSGVHEDRCRVAIFQKLKSASVRPSVVGKRVDESSRRMSVESIRLIEDCNACKYVEEIEVTDDAWLSFVDEPEIYTWTAEGSMFSGRHCKTFIYIPFYSSQVGYTRVAIFRKENRGCLIK